MAASAHEPVRRGWYGYGVLVVLSVAAAVRVGALVGASELPLFTHHRLDAAVYHAHGMAIAGGDWGLGDEVYHLSPLYSYVVGLCYSVFGSGPWSVRVLQLALGILTVAFVLSTARQLLGRRWGLAAGAAAALYGPFLFYETQLSVAALSTCLHAALIWWLVRLAREESGWGRWITAGGLWGLAIVARPNALLLAVAVAAAVVAVPGLSRRARAGRLGLALGIGLALTAPITARNVLVAGDWVWMTDAGGLNLYIGNGPEAIGTFRIPPEVPEARDAPSQFEAFRALAERELGRTLRSSEVDAYWRGRALSAITADPAAWLVLVAEKAWLFWSGRELPSSQDYDFARLTNPLLGLAPVQYGWLAPLGLLGVLLGFRRRPAGARAVAAVVVAGMTGLLIVFVLSHYRVPLVPAVIVLATLALQWLWSRLRARALGALAAGLAVVTAGAVLAFAPKLPKPFDDEYFKLGYAYHLQGDFADAEAAYLDALAVNPDHLSSIKNLAMLAEQRGDPTRAVRLWVRLGQTAQRLSEPDYEGEAREHLRRLGVTPPPGP